MCVMSYFVGREKLSIPTKGKLLFPTHYIHTEHFCDQLCVFPTPTNSLIQTQCPIIQFIGRTDMHHAPPAAVSLFSKSVSLFLVYK